jgi:hypothetical protein
MENTMQPNLLNDMSQRTYLEECVRLLTAPNTLEATVEALKTVLLAQMSRELENVSAQDVVTPYD